VWMVNVVTGVDVAFDVWVVSLHVNINKVQPELEGSSVLCGQNCCVRVKFYPDLDYPENNIGAYG